MSCGFALRRWTWRVGVWIDQDEGVGVQDEA